MNKMKNLLCILCGASLMLNTYARNSDVNAYAFMTARDMKENASSNITISNHTTQSIPAAGLFIASYDVNDCSACTGNIVSGDNLGGTVISPLTFKANQSVAIGQNFLYNLLYNGIYYVKNTLASPCSLPGCTWPGDTPNTKWCITINVVSRHASYTYSNYVNGTNPPANSPAYSEAGNSPPFIFDYKYDLIDPATLGGGNACLGPITCNDQTLTCKVSSAQNESFQPY